MSGSMAGGIPPIRLTLDGQDVVERGLEAVGNAADRMAQRTQASSQQLGALSTVADDVGTKLGTLSSRAQAVSTLLERMGAGQAAQGLTTFSSVLDTVAGAAGRVGASAAAAESTVSSFLASFVVRAAVIGAVAAGLQAAGLGIRTAGDAAVSATEASNRYGSALDSLNGILGQTEQRAQAAALALFQVQRQQALVRAESDLGVQMDRRSEVMRQAELTRGQLSAAETGLATAQERLSTVSGRFGSRGSFTADVERRQREVEALRTRQAALQTEYDRLSGEIDTVGARRQDLLRLTGPGDTMGPPAPERPASGGGGGSGRASAMYGPLDDSGRELSQFWAAQERAREQQENLQRRALERMEDQNTRVTDRIVDYSAERFADLFDKNGKGWDGMLETFERTAKSTAARIAAELFLRPVIAPVVSLLGLGSLGNGNGGFSGIGGLLSGGGGAGGTTAAGGGMDLGGLGQVFSLGRDAYSALTGNTGGGFSLGGVLTNPIWSSGGGFFSAGATAAPSIAGMTTEAALASLPAVPAGTSTLGALGSVSLGTYAAGIGLGYGAGTLIGNSIAKTDAQRTNVQIGSGTGAVGGAVAGAAIGSVVPVIGTAIGAIIGGLVGGAGGGALGGIIGPSSQFSGGDVAVGVDGSGQLTIVGSGGKRWNAAEAVQSTQSTVGSINAVLSGSGTRIVGAPGFGFAGRDAVGIFGYGGSPNQQGLGGLWNNVAPYLQSSNANLQRSLSQGRIGSFDELASAYNFISGTYEPLNRASSVTNAFQQSIDRLTQAFGDAITMAQRLGLEESGLARERDLAIGKITRGRDLTAAAIDAGLASRISGDPTAAALANFDLQAFQERESLTQQLGSLGLDAASRLAQLDQAQAIERQRVASGASGGGSLGNDLAVQLTVGGLGGLSPEAQYLAGLQYLNSARGQGLGAFTNAAQAVLPAARAYLGTSERYSALVAGIGADLRSMGGDPNGLTAILDAQAGGTASLERIAGFSEQSLTVQQDTLTAIRDLALKIETIISRRT